MSTTANRERDRASLRRPLVERYWRPSRHEVSTEEERIVDRLFEWWERIDTWVAGHRVPQPATSAR